MSERINRKYVLPAINRIRVHIEDLREDVAEEYVNNAASDLMLSSRYSQEIEDKIREIEKYVDYISLLLDDIRFEMQFKED